MALTLTICIATCMVMILGVLFFPKIRLGPLRMGSYWLVAMIGALLLLATGRVPLSTVWEALVSDTAINPLKILILFISMTILSIYLDELGFFRYLANKTLKRAGKNQVKLFFYLYLIVSVLTVFTSNDVIILSFTPFICYFARNAKINAVPYLAAEFVAANTWSMALIIGNPTGGEGGHQRQAELVGGHRPSCGLHGVAGALILYRCGDVAGLCLGSVESCLLVPAHRLMPSPCSRRTRRLCHARPLAADPLCTLHVCHDHCAFRARGNGCHRQIPRIAICRLEIRRHLVPHGERRQQHSDERAVLLYHEVMRSCSTS